MSKHHQTAQVSQERDSHANVQRQRGSEEPSNAQTHDVHPLEKITSGIGDAACVAKHVSVIQRTGLFHPMNQSQKTQQLLRLQQRYGNRFVQRVIARHVIQTRLQVSQPGDIYEQEADWVADRVMGMPVPQVQRQSGDEEEEAVQTKPLVEQITPRVQRQAEAEAEEEEEPVSMLQRQEEEEKELQAKEMPGQTPEVTPNLETRINAMRGRGQPLPESERAFFEPRFGYDFSQVRVHTDNQVAESARALNARAFTVGRDVVFGAGQYAPETTEGKRLLAHELTHIVQQRAVQRSPVVVQRQSIEMLSEIKVGDVEGDEHNLREEVLQAMDRLHLLWSMTNDEYNDEYPKVKALRPRRYVPRANRTRMIAALRRNEEAKLVNPQIASRFLEKKISGNVGEGQPNNKRDVLRVQDALYRDWHLTKEQYDRERPAVAAHTGPTISDGMIADTIKGITKARKAIVATGTSRHPTTRKMRTKLTETEQEDLRSLKEWKRMKKIRKLTSPTGSQSGPGGWLEDNAENLKAFKKTFASEMPPGLVPEDLLVLSSDVSKNNPGYRELPPKDLWPNMQKTLRLLRDLGDESGTTFKILSAYRSDVVNALSGGEKGSAHMDFFALDVEPLGDQTKFEAFVKHYWHQKGKARDFGLGFYHPGRVHIDTRSKRRWPKDTWKKEAAKTSYNRYKGHFKLPLRGIVNKWASALQDNWMGTFSSGKKKLDMHLDLYVTGEVAFGTFEYDDGTGGRITGDVSRGKISYKTDKEGNVTRVEIDFEWEEDTVEGKGVLKAEKGILKGTDKKRLAGSWGEGMSKKNRGKLDFEPRP